MSAILHYIYDPLCGWCYGAEPLASAASAVSGLGIELHAGALWPEPTHLPEHMRSYIRQADERIAAMTGQKFGAAYHDGLFADPTMVLYSRPTIAAVLAARALDPAKELPMLKAIQHAHYEHGLRVVEEGTLADIAAELGLDRAAFDKALREVPVDAHIEESRRLMAQVGAQGFPTFLLQVGGDWYPVPHSRFASSPPGFSAWLDGQIKAQAAAR